MAIDRAREMGVGLMDGSGISVGGTMIQPND